MEPISEEREPLVLRTRRPRGARRTALGWVSNVMVWGLTWEGTRHRWTRRPAYAFALVAVILAAISIGARGAIRRFSPYPGRFDTREEVVIPHTLADQVPDFKTEEEFREALNLMRTELGLGFPDALVALSMIKELKKSD